MNHLMKLFLMIAIIGLTAPIASAQDIDELRQRAKAGDAQAMYDLGMMYSFNKGVPPGRAGRRKALGLFREAAEKGNAEAQFRMGVIYEKPWIVNRNYGEAVKWYKRSAVQGFALAQIKLSKFYEKGWGGINKDPMLAYMWATIATKSLPPSLTLRQEKAKALTAAQRATGDAMAERCIKSNFRNCGL